jgi:hypothetical protein
MTRLLTILVSLIAVSALCVDDGLVTVTLNEVSPRGTHSNMWFQCSVTIHNGTSAPLTVNNLFLGPPTLALNISDLDGRELKRVYSVGHIAEPLQWTIARGDNTFTNVWYGLPSGNRRLLSLPEGVHSVRVQVQGILPGSSFTNRLTSNVAEVRVP